MSIIFMAQISLPKWNTSSGCCVKAVLNWVAFDDQIKMVGSNSGVAQVPAITGTTLAQQLVASQHIIQKNGYIYIYVSNESPQKVFFDNLVIHRPSGHLQQEDRFYPIGLTMAGISTKAAMRPDGKYKYNSKELNHKEFTDGAEVDRYSYWMREYDPQIRRFRS